jgi:hypothetical protein
MKKGQRVHWEDPDDGACSCDGTVAEVKGDVVVVQQDKGGVVEAFRKELTPLDILMVDLYGDGQVIRLVENTPGARQAILEWDGQEKPQDFGGMLCEAGVKEILFDEIKLKNE